MKDYLGNDINESDLVVFSSFEGSRLTKGIVVKLTAKKVRIYPTEGASTFSWRDDKTILRDPSYCVVVGHNQMMPDWS